MKRNLIIIAGGEGLRMVSSLPKQFIPIHGKPLLMYTIEVFYRWDATIVPVLVIPEAYASYWKMLCKETNFTVPHLIVYGGETRFHSVRNGLHSIFAQGLIAVHDGVRPLVSPAVISSCFEAAEEFGAAIPVVPMIDSVREIIGDENHMFDRTQLRIVQTPQVFHADILYKAYEQPYNKHFTDEASLVEASGHTIRLIEGNCENIKITTSVDLQFAEISLFPVIALSPLLIK